MNNMRKNGNVGVMEDTEFDKTIHVHFSEWWNGEGMDFDVERTGHKIASENSKYSFTMQEMEMLFAAALAIGMVDLDDVQKRSQELIEAAETRQVMYDTLTKIHENYT